jgi:hypothetical protein
MSDYEKDFRKESCPCKSPDCLLDDTQEDLCYKDYLKHRLHKAEQEIQKLKGQNGVA